MSKAGSGSDVSLQDFVATRVDGRTRGLIHEVKQEHLDQILPARKGGASVKVIQDWLTKLGYQATKARTERLVDLLEGKA
jgi:hypothetical protein